MVFPRSSDSAEIVATCRMSAFPAIGRDIFFSSSTASLAAASMPWRTIMAFAPSAVRFNPSCTIACVRTTAVVVPSPALSLVLDATSFTIEAPIFSNLSSRVISLAIVTPSFVIVGEPQERSRATLRPRGPRVTLTAPATMSTPRFRALRTVSSKITFFAIGIGFRE